MSDKERTEAQRVGTRLLSLLRREADWKNSAYGICSMLGLETQLPDNPSVFVASLDLATLLATRDFVDDPIASNWLEDANTPIDLIHILLSEFYRERHLKECIAARLESLLKQREDWKEVADEIASLLDVNPAWSSPWMFPWMFVESLTPLWGLGRQAEEDGYILSEIEQIESPFDLIYNLLPSDRYFD
jgi:hypothetical protein